MAIIILGLAGAAAIAALVGLILLTIAVGACIVAVLVKADQSEYTHLLIRLFLSFRAVVSSR